MEGIPCGSDERYLHTLRFYMADSQAFRQAWGKFATGVSVVTSKERDGLIHGMAANGIASVSLDPMLVLVCVGHNRNSY